jgi:hypothetical protein
MRGSGRRYAQVFLPGGPVHVRFGISANHGRNFQGVPLQLRLILNWQVRRRLRSFL